MLSSSYCEIASSEQKQNSFPQIHIYMFRNVSHYYKQFDFSYSIFTEKSLDTTVFPNTNNAFMFTCFIPAVSDYCHLFTHFSSIKYVSIHSARVIFYIIVPFSNALITMTCIVFAPEPILHSLLSNMSERGASSPKQTFHQDLFSLLTRNTNLARFH